MCTVRSFGSGEWLSSDCGFYTEIGRKLCGPRRAYRASLQETFGFTVSDRTGQDFYASFPCKRRATALGKREDSCLLRITQRLVIQLSTHERTALRNGRAANQRERFICAPLLIVTRQVAVREQFCGCEFCAGYECGGCEPGAAFWSGSEFGGGRAGRAGACTPIGGTGVVSCSLLTGAPSRRFSSIGLPARRFVS